MIRIKKIYNYEVGIEQLKHEPRLIVTNNKNLSRMITFNVTYNKDQQLTITAIIPSTCPIAVQRYIKDKSVLLYHILRAFKAYSIYQNNPQTKNIQKIRFKHHKSKIPSRYSYLFDGIKI